MSKFFLALCLSVLIADLSEAGLLRRRLKRSFDRNAASGGCERGSGNGNTSGYRLRDSVRRVSHYGDAYYPHPPGSDSPRHENPVNSDNERSQYEDRDRVRNSEQNEHDGTSDQEAFNNGDSKIYSESGEESPRNGEFERDSTEENDNDNDYRKHPHNFEDERNENQEFHHPEPPPPPQRKFRVRRPHLLRFRHPNQFHGGQPQLQHGIRTGTESGANPNSHPDGQSTPNSDNSGPGNTDEATNAEQLTNHKANPIVDEIVHDKTYNIYNQLVEMDQSELLPPNSAKGHQVNSGKIQGQSQSSSDPVSLLTPDTPAEAMFLYAAAESGFKKYPDMVNYNDGTRSLGLYSGLDLSGLAYGGLHSGYTGFGYGGLIPSATTAYGYGGLLPSASTYGLLGNYYAAGNAYGLALPGFRSIVPY